MFCNIVQHTLKMIPFSPLPTRWKPISLQVHLYIGKFWIFANLVEMQHVSVILICISFTNVCSLWVIVLVLFFCWLSTQLNLSVFSFMASGYWFIVSKSSTFQIYKGINLWYLWGVFCLFFFSTFTMFLYFSIWLKRFLVMCEVPDQFQFFSFLFLFLKALTPNNSSFFFLLVWNDFTVHCSVFFPFFYYSGYIIIILSKVYRSMLNLFLCVFCKLVKLIC